MKQIGLARMGLLLVSFPLLCQVLFVVVLAMPLWSLRSNIAEESLSGEIVTATTAILNYAVNLGTMIHNQNSSRSNLLVTKDAAASYARNQFRRVLNISGLDEERHRRISNLVTTADRSIDSVCRIVDASEKKAVFFKFTDIAYKQALRRALTNLIDAADDLLAHEEKRKSVLKASSNADWNTVNSIVAGGLAVSVLAAFALAALYVRAILLPLRNLSANCLRISKQEELSPIMKGDNEFTKVDEKLHAIISATKVQREKEKSMVENTNDLICSLDQNGILLRSNNLSKRFFNVEPDLAIGKSVFDFVCPEDRILAQTNLNEAAKSSEGKSFELRVGTNDGEYLFTRWSCLYSKLTEELFAVVHDIEEEKRIEQMKQDFVDMVSHDLRSPLSSMLFSFEMIGDQSYSELGDEAIAEIDKAQRNLTRLLEFVNDLLDFQRLKHGKMQLDCEDTEIRDLIDTAVEMVKPALDEKSLQITITGEETSFVVDSKKISQVLVNLLSNAIRYSPKGATIALEWKHDGTSNVISVSDQGPGIPLHLQEKIFEAFEQTPETVSKGEGTGLGLAICKLVCEAHGGTIFAENIDGQGSRFTFKIP